MASPLSATRFRDAIKAEGVDVVEVGDWRTHNRNHAGAWGPVHGVMIHHTVTSGTEHSVALCRTGYSTLPGPLCHGVIDKSGRVHLVGYGRTNHAGKGDPDVLAAVFAERSPLPADNEARTDGNARFYGFECINMGDGADPWPEAQVEAVARAAAGICRAHGWGAESVIGHSEWQPGKVDPRGPIGKKGGPALTMDRIRARVAQLLADKPTAPKPTAPKPSKPKPAARPTVSLSKLVAAARRDPGASGTPVSYAGARTVEQALAAEGLLDRRYADGHFGTATVTAYRRWQQRCGYSGAAADGIPGRASLDALARRHAFTVTA
ncbi:N-acetylmuramoyl-L-alanine amidase [Streptomyces sp. enrichment culture]|uniref:N-acetylmuramoyl-L-alanine amidase n=1 Tax=Streptomyces sp. enrichment culture TaxID=1795815 RepID=UPI003F55C417